MTALLGHIEEFAPGKTSWESYYERLEFYFQANNVQNEDQKKAILLTVCGAKTYSVIRSLLTPRHTSDVAYKEIIQIVRKHYDPKPSEIVSRFQFNKRDQHHNETTADYIAELRRLSEFCNFGDVLDQMLRDRLVCGILDEGLQRRFLARESLTFQEAEAEAIAAEAAKRQAAKIRHQPDTRRNFEVRRNLARDKKAKQCFRCGANHAPETCKFRSEKCRYCQKTGHIEDVCLTKAHQQRKNQPKAKTNYSTHNIEPARQKEKGKDDNERESFQCIDEPGTSTYSLNSVKAKNAPAPLRILLMLNGSPHTMEVDSGSPYSIISDDSYKNVFKPEPPPLQASEIRLQTWNRHSLEVLGQMLVNVELNNQKAKLQLLVVKGNGVSLIGRDWFEPLGLNFSGTGRNAYLTQVNEILRKYDHVFAEELGRCSMPPIKIEIVKDAVPVFRKSRPVPFALRDKITRAIDDLVQQEIFQPIEHSDWATPIVPVVKKSGEIRLCGDYKGTVNKVTRKNTYPLPTIKDILATLGGGRVFSKLDMSQAYQQLTVDDDTARILTLNTPKGLMKVKRLQFGINVAPNIFQRCIEQVLSGLEGAQPYLDDILVTGKDLQEHNARLEAVLGRISEAGLRLKREKCIFASSQIEYLGYKLSEDGVHPTLEKVRAIHATPAPTNKTQLQGFLGLLNFYSMFLRNRATILEPLHRLLDKNAKWSWEPKHQKAFDDAKKLLSETAVLSHYDPDRPLLITCDASPYGIGAILSHYDPDHPDKSMPPIAFASRTLSVSERNYAQIDKEALAVIYGVKKFHEYVCGRTFTIFTDHKPLLGILQNGKQMPQVISPRMLRWSLLLGAYDYELRYVPGTKIANADGLSRLPVPVKPYEPPPPADILLLEADDQESIIDAEDIAKATRKDQVLSRILQWTLKGFPEALPDRAFAPYFSRRNELSTHRGCLLWGCRVIVPPTLRSYVLEILHDSHPGMVQMKSVARSYVWWPGLDEEIEKTVRRCEPCQQNARSPPRAPTFLREMTERPWSRLHLDIAGPFQKHYF